MLISKPGKPGIDVGAVLGKGMDVASGAMAVAGTVKDIVEQKKGYDEMEATNVNAGSSYAPDLNTSAVNNQINQASSDDVGKGTVGKASKYEYKDAKKFNK